MGYCGAETAQYTPEITFKDGFFFLCDIMFGILYSGSLHSIIPGCSGIWSFALVAVFRTVLVLLGIIISKTV